MHSTDTMHASNHMLIQVFFSLWTSFVHVLAIVHLRPLYLAYLLALLLILSILLTIIQGIRGRTPFTLERQPGAPE